MWLCLSACAPERHTLKLVACQEETLHCYVFVTEKGRGPVIAIKIKRLDVRLHVLFASYDVMAVLKALTHDIRANSSRS